MRLRQQVLDELASLVLSPNTTIFVTDADAMYNNIDTDHAIQVTDLDSRGLLPSDFPLEEISEAMELVMKTQHL